MLATTEPSPPTTSTGCSRREDRAAPGLLDRHRQLTLFLFGASAPSPLYVVYQRHFGFSATTLTAIFAVYALALLVTLVPAGALSDQVGRRPVILAAIALQAAAMVLFLLADATATLFAARILQGIATGAGYRRSPLSNNTSNAANAFSSTRSQSMNPLARGVGVAR